MEIEGPRLGAGVGTGFAAWCVTEHATSPDSPPADAEEPLAHHLLPPLVSTHPHDRLGADRAVLARAGVSNLHRGRPSERAGAGDRPAPRPRRRGGEEGR